MTFSAVQCELRVGQHRSLCVAPRLCSEEPEAVIFILYHGPRGKKLAKACMLYCINKCFLFSCVCCCFVLLEKRSSSMSFCALGGSGVMSVNPKPLVPRRDAEEHGQKF